MIDATPKLIDNLDFHDADVRVYYDCTSEENTVRVGWQVRNPSSFYVGMVYMNNETGKITYPEDAVIPEQTERDREMLPKFVVIGKTELDLGDTEIILERLEKQYLLRNRKV